MPKRPCILIIEDDDGVAELLVEHFRDTFDADVYRTAGATETLNLDGITPDLIMLDLQLPDGNGLDLARMIRIEQRCPILLMTAKPTMGRAVEALRVGVQDLFTKPFDLQRLTTVATEQLDAFRDHRRQERRYERQKRLVSKVLDERQALQERVDLVCQDLVQAYRNLADKFAAEHPRA
jgi:DNA-binding response OmpR family regulator